MRKITILLSLLAGAALAQPPSGQFLLRIEPVRADFKLQSMTPEEARAAGEHMVYLNSLAESGKLRFAGQAFDPKGLWGIIVVDAPDRGAAVAILENDPMIQAKTFRGEVTPFRTTLERSARDSVPAPAVDAKTLEGYAGTYKSDQIPLAIKAFVKEGKLYLQANGQPEFPLKAKNATEFEFAAAGVAIAFDSSSSFTLKQGGANTKFKKTVSQ